VQEWYAVTFGEGTFVAVSTTGTNRVMTSTNGVTWQGHQVLNSGGGANDSLWRSVAYGNGRFVAVAGNNASEPKVMYSDNGSTWTTSACTPPVANTSLYSIAYGAGQFIAVGNDTQGIKTSDGASCSGVNFGNMFLKSITFGDGLFVATGTTGAERQSSNSGSTWSTSTAASNNNWMGVTYAGGRFVAVAENTAGSVNQVMTSGTFTAPTAPAVTTSAATSVATTSTTLNGSVNANGGDTSILTIKYSTTQATVDAGGGTEATVSPVQALGTSATSVSAALTGLSQATTYYYRVSATNVAGTTSGSTLSFTTTGPAATTTAATNVTSTSATLNGTVNANNASSSVTLKYSAVQATVDAGNGTSVTAAQSPVTGASATAVSAAISGLSPGTTYYFRTSATNADGSSNGSTLSFTTLAAPTVTTSAATTVSGTGATLNGSVNANGADTSALTIKYSTDQATVDAGGGTSVTVTPTQATGSSATSVSASVTGLTPSTTYYFRVAATNSVGTTNGATLSFSTSGPTVTTSTATNITESSATVGAIVNANGNSTSALSIRYDTDASVVAAGGGSTSVITPTQATGSSNTTVTANLTDLQPSTTYYFRAAATNPDGTGYGSVLSFTTGVEAPVPDENPGPASQVQQVGMPASGTCMDVDETGLAWGTGLSGGWNPSWASWRNGPVCSRTLIYLRWPGIWALG
jgi:phosphodiesterase/alkaline phosphatase D-like protein